MNYLSTLIDLKSRAERLNLSWRQVCVGAGVNYPTVSAWLKDGDQANPSARALQDAERRIGDYLESREAQMFAYLVQERGFDAGEIAP